MGVNGFLRYVTARDARYSGGNILVFDRQGRLYREINVESGDAVSAAFNFVLILSVK